MVFKRYIKKHGKKLGPYYYENVRGKDGSVKSVYVGTNPHHHPRHKIRKPLFFLILALVLILVLGGSLFLLQNKSYVIKKVAREPNFEVDQILLKVLIRQNEFVERQLRVTNIGDGPSSLSVEVHGLSDLINVDSKTFTIKPGQTKILRLNFSSFIAAENIEQQPGVYVGKFVIFSEKASREVPTVIEIETKNILFDMNLNPIAIERRVKQGTDTTIEVRLFNLESIESQNVDVEYFVKDMNGNTIVTESETVVVKTQASFFKTVSIPKNLKPGPYVFAGKLKFGNSIGTSSYLFEVVGPEEVSFVQFCKNSILCLGLSVTTLLLLFALTAYFYFFVGAYLYEKISGAETIPGKSKREKLGEKEIVEAKPEGPKVTLFDRVNNKIQKWRKTRERKQVETEKKSQEELRKLKELEEKKGLEEQRIRQLEGERKKQEELRRQKEISKLAEEKRIQLELERKQVETEKKSQEELRGQAELKKQEELKKQKAEGERKKQEDELRKLKELEEKKKLEEQRKRKLESKKLWSERRQKTKEFLHKIGLYKTPEEKRQIALQKDNERQEGLRREEELEKQKAKGERKKQEEQKKLKLERKRSEEELRKLKELEEKKGLEEQRIRQLEWERKKQEELKRQEELKARQKEKEQIRVLEEKLRIDEKKRRELNQKEAQKESENQRQEKLKAKKLEEIRQIEANLEKNKKDAELINSKISRLKREEGPLENSISELDARIKRIDIEVLDKSEHNKRSDLQKNSLLEKYEKELEELAKKQEIKKKAKSANIKELKARLTAKRNALIKDLEEKLDKLSPKKRRATERWERLELKAKLKIEENALEEELRKYEGEAVDVKKKLEDNYKKDLIEIAKKCRGLKREIADLKSRKKQILLEKGKLLENQQDKSTRIQRARIRLENNAKERASLNAELSKRGSDLSKLSLGFFSTLISGYKSKTTEDDRFKEIEEKIKAREEERKAEEEQKKLNLEEKLRAKEEKRKRKLERGRLWSERRQKTKEFLHKIGLYKTPEEKRQIALQKENQREEISKKKAPEEAPKIEERVKEGKLPKEEKAQEEPKAKETEFEFAKPKSRKFEKCYKTLDSARDVLNRNKVDEAKKLYLEARNLYLELEYHEKKDIYDELMEFYNRLLK